MLQALADTQLQAPDARPVALVKLDVPVRPKLAWHVNEHGSPRVLLVHAEATP